MKNRLLDLVYDNSLIERLWKEKPDLFIRPENIGGKYLEETKSTTILALKYDDGVVAASDGQATSGDGVIGFDKFDKLIQVEKHTIIAIAGAPTIALQICQMMKAEIRIWNKTYSNKLSTEGKISRLSAIMRKNMAMLQAGIVVVPIYITFEPENNKGRIFQFEPTGSHVEREFHSEGSGGRYAKTVIAANLLGKFGQLSREKAVKLAIASLVEAHRSDAMTGENLFVKVIDKNGASKVSPEEIAELQEQIKKGYK
ncbi:MAG: hypothetical protein M1334_03725 [Patescibacteria group bacterium]|nr:hypothetical protein [Patescibacteria group bacterium]